MQCPPTRSTLFPYTTLFRSPRAQADARAAEIVSQLTLEEKLPQLLNTAPAIPRLGIPAYNWWTESLHGALGDLPTTNFPDRKSTRLNSSHVRISYAVFCLKK